MINRYEVATALAKAIAFKTCGRDIKAQEWARRLVELLECAQILKTDDYKECSGVADDPRCTGQYCTCRV